MTLKKKAATRARFSRLTVGLASIALVLTGCGDNSEAQPSSSQSATESAAPSPTSTPTPTPTPTPASADGPARNIPVPEMPEAATKETKAGLLAFVNYWYEMVSFAYVSGETGRLNSIATEECGTCGNVVELIRDSHKGDSWMVGGEIDVLRTETDFAPNTSGHYQVLLEFEQKKLQIYDRNGLQDESDPDKGPFYHLFVAEFTGDKWRLIDTGLPGESKR